MFLLKLFSLSFLCKLLFLKLYWQCHIVFIYLSLNILILKILSFLLFPKCFLVVFRIHLCNDIELPALKFFSYILQKHCKIKYLFDEIPVKTVCLHLLLKNLLMNTKRNLGNMVIFVLILYHYWKDNTLKNDAIVSL